MIAQSYFFQGRFAEAREWAEEGFRMAPWDAVATGFLARVLMHAGEKDRAQALLARLPGMIPSGMVRYHLVSSEIDAALDWYEKGIEQRHAFAALWASATFLQPLRASPRWPKLAKMMNLPGTGSWALGLADWPQRARESVGIGSAWARSSAPATTRGA